MVAGGPAAHFLSPLDLAFAGADADWTENEGMIPTDVGAAALKTAGRRQAFGAARRMASAVISHYDDVADRDARDRMDIAERIAGMIEPALTDMGYALVRVQLSGAARLTLQIMAERADGENMTVDDCADISRAVSALLDVEDPIEAAYSLEVSSPGIDRPLVKPADYQRWAGFEARIETAMPVDGRKRFRGRLIGLAGDDVKLRLDDGADAAVPLAAITRAKLMLTDDLIEAAQSGKRI